MKSHEQLKNIVSVPFPGILFLNERELDIRERELEQFPSPSRGSYFSMIAVWSVPLLG